MKAGCVIYETQVSGCRIERILFVHFRTLPRLPLDLRDEHGMLAIKDIKWHAIIYNWYLNIGP